MVTQAPFAHCLPPPQVTPHAPQFTLSDLRFAQVPEGGLEPPSEGPASAGDWEHRVSPDWHVSPHLPPLHTCPAPQSTPHPPQLALSVWGLTHELPQRVWVLSHDEPHLPDEHTSPAAHFVPHAPQLSASTCVSLQVAPHRVVPPPHDEAQAPREHTSPALHAAPHAPQYALSDASSTHPPPHEAAVALHVGVPDPDVVALLPVAHAAVTATPTAETNATVSHELRMKTASATVQLTGSRAAVRTLNSRR